MRRGGAKTTKTSAHSHDGVRQTSHLRALNLERVLEVLVAQPGPLTRTQVIHHTGLSAPTVGTLSAHLIRLGLLQDLGTRPSRGGRRPTYMEFNARYGYAGAIALGPTQTRLAVADLRGQVLLQRVMETPLARDPKTLLESIAAEMRVLLRDAGVSARRLLAIAAGAPGAVDHERGVVLALAPNLKNWVDVPMADILRRLLGAPVIVDNDMNFAVLGEHWRGAARDHETCAFITVGTGIGAGILIDGEVHRGHHFLAGEIALMCMGPQYVETNFGARGCLETLAGLNAIKARWPHPPELEGDGLVRRLFEAAHTGDRRAGVAAEEIATLIGMAIANLSVVLDPSLIVIGGEVIDQAPTLVDDVRRVVARIVPTPSPIVPTVLGNAATLWGALLAATTLARERLRQRLRAGAGIRQGR